MNGKVYNNARDRLFEDKIVWMDDKVKDRLDDYAEFLAILHALCSGIKVVTVTYFRDAGAVEQPMIAASKVQGGKRLHKNATFTLLPEGRWKASCGWHNSSATLTEGEAINYARCYFSPHLVDEDWIDYMVGAWKQRPEDLRLGQFLIGNYAKSAESKKRAIHYCHTSDIFHYQTDTWQKCEHVIAMFKRRFASEAVQEAHREDTSDR